jgi:carbon-monoxide dehydrogenase small subunit
MTVHVKTKINGDAVDFVCEADETLLDVLRLDPAKDRLDEFLAKRGVEAVEVGSPLIHKNLNEAKA